MYAPQDDTTNLRMINIRLAYDFTYQYRSLFSARLSNNSYRNRIVLVTTTADVKEYRGISEPRFSWDGIITSSSAAHLHRHSWLFHTYARPQSEPRSFARHVLYAQFPAHSFWAWQTAPARIVYVRLLETSNRLLVGGVAQW